MKHSTKSNDIEGLRPYAGGNPLIEVDFEIDGRDWRISKQFGRSRRAELHQVGGQSLWRGRDAEAKLADLIGLPNGLTGPFGLVWVEQKRGLSPPDPDPQVDPQTGRGRDLGERSALMRAIENEIMTVSGGDIASDVQRRVRADLGALVSSRGARKGGALDEAKQRLGVVEKALCEAHAAAVQTAKAIEELDDARGRYRVLNDPRHVAQLEKAYLVAREASESAQKVKRDYDLTKQKRALARERLGAAEGALASFDKDAAELLELEKISASEAGRIRELKAKSAEDESALNVCKQAVEDLGRQVEELTKQQLLRAQVDQRQNMIEQLEDRRRVLRQAEKLSQDVAELSEALRSDPATSQRLQRLEKLLREIALAEERIAGGAAQIEIDYYSDAKKRFEIDGVAIEESRTLTVTEPLLLEVADIGRINVVPGRSAERSVQEEIIRGARAETDIILRLLNVSDVDAARARYKEREARESELSVAKAELGVLAPEGLHPLRTEISQFEEKVGDPVAGEQLASVEDLADRFGRAKEELNHARAEYEVISNRQGENLNALARSQGRSGERTKRIEELIGVLGIVDERSSQRKKILGDLESAKDVANDCERAVVALEDSVPDAKTCKDCRTRRRRLMQL